MSHRWRFRRWLSRITSWVKVFSGVSKTTAEEEGAVGGEVTWDELLEKLLEIFNSDQVDVDEVMDLLASYNTNPKDWKKFAKFDTFKYTRNLVHEGNGKFNLMLLCWAPGNQSSIHDHSDAHCFVKCLAGDLKETKFHWPEEKRNEDGSLVTSEEEAIGIDDVSYMSDQLGLHRVENVSHSDKAVSLHLYSPPFNSCQVFDELSGSISMPKAPMTFWSKFGQKVRPRMSERMYDVQSIAD